MLFNNAETVLSRELTVFKRRLKQVVASSDGIGPLTRHFDDFQGKHLRPIMLMLALKAVAPAKPINAKHIDLAVTMELIHNTALVHDDVLDESRLRRNVKTYNQRWGNEIAVIFGDYLFARLFSHIIHIKSEALLKEISQVCIQLCLGELRHLNKRFNLLGISQKEYLEIINNKTASLFELSSYLGAVSATKNPKIIAAMKQYGRNFGLAYQIMDDYWDIVSSDRSSGKSTGNDLFKGKITMPIIRTIEHPSKKYQTRLKQLIKSLVLDGTNLPALKKELRVLLEESGALAYAHGQAEEYARKAVENIAPLPDSNYKKLLAGLAMSII